MSHGHESRAAGADSANPPRYSLDVQSALVSDGFSAPGPGAFAAPVPDLPPAEDAPPPYGELHDQLQFSQPGFEAGANVTRTCFPRPMSAPAMAVSKRLLYWTGPRRWWGRPS